MGLHCECGITDFSIGKFPISIHDIMEFTTIIANGMKTAKNMHKNANSFKNAH